MCERERDPIHLEPVHTNWNLASSAFYLQVVNQLLSKIDGVNSLNNIVSPPSLDPRILVYPVVPRVRAAVAHVLRT